MRSVDVQNLTKEELVHFFRSMSLYRAVSEKDLAWARYKIANRKARSICHVASQEMDTCELPQDWERYNKAMKDYNKGMALYAEADKLFKAWERLKF